MPAVVSSKNEKVRDVEWPTQFLEEFRPDVIARAVRAMQANARQPYGAFPEAGMQVAADLSRRRRKYRGSYGQGISRVPRKILSRSGTRFNWVGAEAPGTVGGRRAHPPKAEKNWSQKINRKERKLAIRSALHASITPEIVKQRGHEVPKTYPFIADDTCEDLAKTLEVKQWLEYLGLKEELERTSEVKIKAGKAKMRNRRRKKKIGPLLVVSKPCKLRKAAENIPGVEVCVVSRLNAELLAPGAQPGRITVFTQAALKRMADEQLFMEKK